VRAREWDFVEGALSIAERAWVQTHLDGCESCRREMMLCRSAEEMLLSAAMQIPPAGDLRTAFYTRLAEQNQQQSPRHYRRPAALSALALGLLALALVRPALQHQAGSRTPIRNTEVAFVPTAAPPAATPRLPQTLMDTKLPPRRSVPSLSEDQASRLVAVEKKYIVPWRHRTAQNRPTVYSRLRTHPISMNPLVGDTLHREGRLYANRVPVQPLNGGTSVVKRFAAAQQLWKLDLHKKIDKADARAPAASLSAGNSPYRDAKLELAAAVIPTANGVSLEVTDQVRGFSNTTHVASKVEVQDDGSTIHVEADGN
jgi:hypothetical protein